MAIIGWLAMGRGQKFLLDDDSDVCVFLFGINLCMERGGQYLPLQLVTFFVVGD
jgi:hypothetical protein